MRHHQVLILLSLCFVVLSACGSGTQDEMSTPASVNTLVENSTASPTTDIIITTTALFGATVTTITFKHSTHTAYGCGVCHPAGEAVGNIPSLDNAATGKEWAHNLCYPCHLVLQKGPTACKGCHINVAEVVQP